MLLFSVADALMFIYAYKRRGDNFVNLCAVLIIITIILFNNQNIAHSSYMQLVSMVGIFAFFIYSSRLSDWHEGFMILLSILGIFYAFMTFFTWLRPSVFYSVVVPLFEQAGEDMSSAVRQYQNGYLPGLTKHYSTNAMYLAVALGAPATMFFAGKFRLKKYIVYVVVIMSALLATGKRAHSVFAIIALLAVYYFLNCDKPLQRWFKVAVGLFIAAGFFVIAAQFIPILMNVVRRFSETYHEGRFEMGRDRLRAIAFSLWKNHLWFGIGWDGYKYRYLNTYGFLLNGHCVYLQLLCEVGIIGSAPFYVFFMSCLSRSILTLKKTTMDGNKDQKRIIGLSYSVYIQIFFLLYCITGNPLYDEPTLFTYIMGCAIGEYYYHSNVKKL